MNRVFKRPQALLDLADIAEYISGDSPAAALRFLAAAEQSFDLLAAVPEIGGLWLSSRPE